MSAWLCYHARLHAMTFAAAPLPLASAAPHRTPHHASLQLITPQWKPTTTAISQYSQTLVLHTHFCSEFDPDLEMPFTKILRRPTLDTIIKVNHVMFCNESVNKSVLSLVTQLSTWCYPHLLLACTWHWRRALSSKPAARHCCCRSMANRDRRTDSRSLHRPCSAYYASSVSKNWTKAKQPTSRQQ